MKKIKILVSGTHYSGSGAVVDLLSEYEPIAKVGREFDDFRRVGLVGDFLEKRFWAAYPSKFEEYISEKGHYRYVHRIFSTPTKGKRKKIHEILDQGVNLFRPGSSKEIDQGIEFLAPFVGKNEELSVEARFKIAKEWMRQIEHFYGKDKSYLLLDQPVFHGQHLNVWPKIFDPFKLIVVVRDPCDQIAQIIESKHFYLDFSTCLTHGLQEIYGGSDEGVLRYHIDVLDARLKSILRLQSALNSGQLIIVRFEDLVLNFEENRAVLSDFVSRGGPEICHQRRFEAFNPADSKKNLGLRKNYLELFGKVSFDKVYRTFDKLEMGSRMGNK